MSLDDHLVSDIMVRDVEVVSELTSLQNACNLMYSKNIGCVVVVTDASNKRDLIPVGIITERDVIRQIGIDPYRSHYSVSELLKRPLIIIPPSTSLRYALRLMVSESIRRLPVVENSKLVGIVTDRDIYNLLVKDESLIYSIANDELLMKHFNELQQPFAHRLLEVIRKTGNNSATNS